MRVLICKKYGVLIQISFGVSNMARNFGFKKKKKKIKWNLNQTTYRQVSNITRTLVGN